MDQRRLFDPGPLDPQIEGGYAGDPGHDDVLQQRAGTDYLKVRANPDAALAIATDGVIKAQRQSGTTNGSDWTEERGRFEDGLGKGDLVYGYYGSQRVDDEAARYGSATMRLNQNARGRAFMSASDSLGLEMRQNYMPDMTDRPIAAPVGDVAAGTARVRNSNPGRKLSGVGYVEGQVAPDEPTGVGVDANVAGVDFQHYYGAQAPDSSALLASRQFEQRGIPTAHFERQTITQPPLPMDIPRASAGNPFFDAEPIRTDGGMPQRDGSVEWRRWRQFTP